LEAAKKVTAAALKINVGDKELANELLQGGITVGRLNNSDDFEAAFGQLRSSSKASQAVDENEFLGNILGKMAALTRGRKNMDGMTTERALEYMTAASRIQVDRTGDTSSTNMAAIYQRMDDFMPELKKVLKDKSVSRVDQKTIDAFKAARTFDEKLALLRSNKDLGNQFIDKQRTGGPRELAFAMVQNDKNVRALMKEAEDAVVPFAQAGAVFKEATDQIRDAVPGLIANRELAAGKEFAATSDREMLLGQARAAYDSIWNADANGNAPVNLSGWDRGKRAMVGTEMEFRRGGTKRDGTAFNEAEILAFGVQKLLGAELQKRGSDRNQPAVDSLTKQLTVLEKIATHLESLDNKANGERFLPPERRAMMPPLAFRPRVLAPAAAAAAAAR
jgi:hypothetical protein